MKKYTCPICNSPAKSIYEDNNFSNTNFAEWAFAICSKSNHIVPAYWLDFKFKSNDIREILCIKDNAFVVIYNVKDKIQIRCLDKEFKRIILDHDLVYKNNLFIESSWKHISVSKIESVLNFL